MANLTAVFELIDRMSDKMDAIASRGESAVENWERMGEAADKAQEIGVAAVASVATAVSDYSRAVDGAAGTTDYWTEAVGNYNKSAMEAMMTTEELVEAGFKSAKALEEEESVMELTQMATEDLSKAMENSANIHEACATAMEKAAQTAGELADSEKVSEQTKQALQEATERAEAAFEELEAAQKAAQDAMDNYNAVAESGTATITELEAAALNAATAADNLVAANEKAATATEELSKATEDAAEETENAGNKGITAVQGIAGALTAAGITAIVKEISESVYELADAFSEAESTVVLATGATGTALGSLTDSMMNAYAASKTGSLDETAAAVGEINTRLGYTGEVLEETTGLFLDFAAVTGGNAASSVKSVTQLMNQWNVDANDMEMMLSKLTYAGQASGISVDTLSGQLVGNKAVLDQLGFSLDEATALFMNFELAGTNASSIMMGFRTALASGAISSLEELYDVFDRIQAGEINAADAAEIFGSRAGAAIVDAANSGVFAMDGLVAALENSSGTLKTTADAAQTLAQKWEQATNKIKAAFESAIAPTIKDVSGKLAEIVGQFGDFLNEHPALVQAISAVGSGLGVVALGVAGIGAASAAAAVKVTAFGTAFKGMSAAVLPTLGVVAAAIAVVTGGIMLFKGAYDEAYDQAMAITPVYAKNADELERLEAEYEEACETFGEFDTRTLQLKNQIEDLSDAMRLNEGSMDDWLNEVDRVIAGSESLRQSIDETAAAIVEEKGDRLGKLLRLQEMWTAEELSPEDVKRAKNLIGDLNQTPGVQIDYDEWKNDPYAAIGGTQAVVEAYADYESRKANREAYESLQDEKSTLEDKMRELEVQGAAAEWEYFQTRKTQQMVQMDEEGNTHFSFAAWGSQSAAKNKIKEIEEAQAALTAEQDKVNQKVDEYNEKMEAAERTARNALSTATNEGEAVAAAFSLVEDQLFDVAAAYDEVYNATLESLKGQFSLYDKAEFNQDAGLENIQNNLQSQSEYYETLARNRRALAEMQEKGYEGLEESLKGLLSEDAYEALMAAVEQDASLLNEVLYNLSEGNDELVAGVGKNLLEVQEKMEDVAAAEAEKATGIKEINQEIVENFQGLIEDLELSDEAKESAVHTFEGYIEGIMSQKGSLFAAVSSMKGAIIAGLTSGVSGGNDVFGEGEIPLEAQGTTNAPEVFIAGEEGPELIVGKAGATVFPHGETERILDAFQSIGVEGTQTAPSFYVPDSGRMEPEFGNGGEAERRSERKITLEIEGKGNIQLQGDKADEESMLAFLYEYLKPVLSEILKQEIYEEGDYSYGY